MRCLHFVATLDHGGTEVTCRDIVKVMTRTRKIESRIMAFSEGLGTIRPQLERASGNAVRVVPGGARVVAAMYLLYHFVRWRPDAVLIHLFGVDHLLVALVARLLLIRRISVKAGNPPVNAEAAKWRGVLILNRILDVPIVAASQYIYDRLAAFGPLPVRSTVIHNGCDVQAIFATAEGARRDRHSATFNFGMISRLDPIKDHATLLRAFRIVHDRKPNTKLTLVGDGVLRAELEATAVSLGVAASVRFLGAQSEIGRLLGEMDAFIFSTTDEEGFGIVLIEALAAAAPIVASDVPACREVLRGGELGRLVPVHDVQALADGMSATIDDIASERSRRTAQLSTVEDLYSIEKTALRHASLLQL